MSKSLESRITDASSKDTFRKAKKIAQDADFLCSLHTSQNKQLFVFKDTKVNIHKCEVDTRISKDFNYTCTCRNEFDSLCIHAATSILYLAKYAKNGNKDNILETKSTFSGLKDVIPKDMAGDLLQVREGKVHISAETAFPHVPSKWERVTLAVTLSLGKKTFKGNIANLRQLHFKKKIAASLSLDDFAQHERQIIRYLAINSEQDGTKISLDAEKTAEFFHCLITFPYFYRNEKRVIVHRETAEPILVCEKVDKEFILKSSVCINNRFLALNESVKVITGRSGCWIGLHGEYWWVPGTVDVAWLRSFVKTPERRCSLESALELFKNKNRLPIPLIEAPLPQNKLKRPKVLYSAKWTKDNALHINLNFDYNGIVLDADEGHLAADNHSFWERNTKKEKLVVDELLSFGFARKNENFSTFILTDIEAIGFFLDNTIKLWISESRNFYMSTNLSNLCCGGHGVPLLQMETNDFKIKNSEYLFKYKLFYQDNEILWDNLVKFLKQNRRFLKINKLIIKVSNELANLALMTTDLIKAKKEVLYVPKFAAPYWLNQAKNIPNAIPIDLKLIDKKATVQEPKKGAKSNKLTFKGSLRDYQKESISWMQERGELGYNLILADEMGLGKTVQTLALFANVQVNKNPHLILCPTSLSENWKREAIKFLPKIKVLIVIGSNRKTLWEKCADYDLIIASYAIAKRDLNIFIKQKFNYLVLDEAQHIKNPTTANSTSCKQINSERKLVLTGTPLENSSEDLWSIFDFLHPGLLGNFNSFKKTYANIHNNIDLQSDLIARIKPFILRRTKDKVSSELPKKNEQILFCDMCEKQQAFYNEILNDTKAQLFDLLKNNTKSASIEILTKLMRLRQICCHPAVLKKSLGTDVEESAKMELLKEVVLENLDSGHKILVFSQFTSVLAIIKQWMNEAEINYEYLDGATKNRQDVVDKFNNNPATKVFLLSLKAGGTGLNLTSADTVILYDPWWNPAVENQAADRVHRIGQKRNVNIMKLVVNNTIEEKILKLQDKKQDIFDNLIENPSKLSKKISLDDISFLLDTQ